MPYLSLINKYFYEIRLKISEAKAIFGLFT